MKLLAKYIVLGPWVGYFTLIVVLPNKSGVHLPTTEHRHGWWGKREVFTKMHNSGEQKTPQIQANLFFKTQEKTYLFPKRLKPKTMPRNPTPSLPDLLKVALGVSSPI